MNPRLLLPLVLLARPLVSQQPAADPAAAPPRVDADQKTAAPVLAPAPAWPTAARSASAGVAAGAIKTAATHASRSGRLPADAVLVDQPGDGQVWARARRYKASFDGAAATYIPFLGSDAPHNYPVRFTLRGVQAGGDALAFRADGTATVSGRQVRIDRGALVETWDLDAKGAEQSFVFKSVPVGGDLVLEIGVATELQPQDATEGLRFGNALGAVDYGAAFVVDATGRREPIATSCADGVIRLRAPAAFLATAVPPITIDPMVTTFTVRNSNASETSSDLAYDASTAQYLIVWEEAFSATDHDIGSVRQDRDGNQIAGSLAYVDASSTHWAHPRVGNLNASHRFLVVGERGLAPGRQIWGRTREAGSQLMSTPFEISGNGGFGDKLNPDVGGNGNPSGPNYWSVVWERTFSATDSDVNAQLVDDLGALRGGVIPLANSFGTVETRPAISKSNGGAPSASQEWIVVWQYLRTATEHDIRFARIHWDGTLTQAAAALAGNTVDFANPVVSSPTDEINGRRYWLACFQAALSPTNRDLGAVLGSGSQLIANDNLSMIESPGSEYLDQVEPQVDSDGCRFAVVWAEQYGGTDYDVMASTCHVVTGARLGFTESRVRVGSSTNAERLPRVCATRGATDHRYGLCWQEEYAAGDWDVSGSVYEGLGLGGVTMLPIGCAGLGMTTGGGTALGETAVFHMTGAGANLPVMMFSLPIAPLTVCGGCGLGVKLSTATFYGGDSFALQIPCDGLFVGGTVAVQGFTYGVGPCVNGALALSPAALLRVR